LPAGQPGSIPRAVMAGVILGNWTHRRGDAGGTRALAADVADAKPRIAWSWSPPHGGRVDQVRIAGEHVFVVAMDPVDPATVGWEHATVYAVDAATGAVVARRRLADAAPVAAMVIEGRVLHLATTGPGEPIVWYALDTPDLVPLHRRHVDAEHARSSDVLDAWASPDGGLWLEVEASRSGANASDTARAFHFLAAETREASAGTHRREGMHAREASSIPLGFCAQAASGEPSDACAAGRTLFAPWDGDVPSVHRLDPGAADAVPDREWMRGKAAADRWVLHSVLAGGALTAIVVAQRDAETHVDAITVDATSGVVRTEASADGLVRELGVGSRMVRRPNGETLLQRIGADGAPCTDLVCALPDGSLTSCKLGVGRGYVLDLCLGDTLLAHRAPKDGHVVVGAFAVVQEGGWLGRRTSALWSIDLGSGGEPTLYAGAGHLVVRDPRGLTAIRI
jgi:hypothetical protein